MHSHDAAFIFTGLSVLVALFQFALVLGAPWGDWTLGGRWKGVLPVKVRLLPLLSMALLGLYCVVVRQHAGVAMVYSMQQPSWAIWVVVAGCALGVLANAVTPSARERLVWLPVNAAMLASSLVVAMA